MELKTTTFKPTNDRMARFRSAAETIDTGSIRSRVKSKTLKSGIDSFHACRLVLKETV